MSWADLALFGLVCTLLFFGLRELIKISRKISTLLKLAEHAHRDAEDAKKVANEAVHISETLMDVTKELK